MYATTFNLEDFYVPVVAFAETEFEECPVIPSFSLVQERKKGEIHDFFWRNVVDVLPCLKKGEEFYIVTDEETAIVQYIKGRDTRADAVGHISCWLLPY